MVIVILDKSNSDNSDNGNKSNSGDNKGEQKKLDIFFLLSLYLSPIYHIFPYPLYPSFTTHLIHFQLT